MEMGTALQARAAKRHPRSSATDERHHRLRSGMPRFFRILDAFQGRV